MKIFSADKTPSAKQAAPSNNKGKAKAKLSSFKKPMSDSAIREKVAANAEISSAAKAKASADKGAKLGEGFMNADNHLLKTDVQLNNPGDPVTAEKLKSVLTTGAFNFNPKEREVLSKILEE